MSRAAIGSQCYLQIISYHCIFSPRSWEYWRCTRIIYVCISEPLPNIFARTYRVRHLCHSPNATYFCVNLCVCVCVIWRSFAHAPFSIAHKLTNIICGIAGIFAFAHCGTYERLYALIALELGSISVVCECVTHIYFCWRVLPTICGWYCWYGCAVNSKKKNKFCVSVLLVVFATQPIKHTHTHTDRATYTPPKSHIIMLRQSIYVCLSLRMWFSCACVNSRYSA